MSTPVCVCLSEVALYWGPAPELGTSDARGRVTSPAEKTKRPAPPPLVEPDHCMMTFGAALSQLSFLLPPRAPPTILPARLAHVFRTRGYGALLPPPVGENGPLPSASSQQIRCSASSLVLFSSCWRVQPFSFVSLLFSPACPHPSLFSAIQPLLLTWDQISAKLWQCFNCPRVQLGAENEGCYQKV